MFQNLRQRSSEESGFTLVELLVVMLILGLLAAIAVPSFFNQREKAKDADAKASVRTAQTAIETYATDNGGEYTGATGGLPTSNLNVIESTLNDADLSVVSAGEDTYEVAVTSEGNEANVFSITRLTDGTVELTCTEGGVDGCPTGGVWGE